MKAKTRYPTCCVTLAAAMILVIGCNSYNARREMDEGKKQYREGNLPAAAEHFKAAASLDDNLVAAKLNLATTYRVQYEGLGTDVPANARLGEQAIDVYQKVLEKDPRNMVALKGIGCAAMDIKKFDQAMDFRKRALALSPADPESYFWVGVVDWSAVNGDTRAQKTKLGMGPDEPFRGNQDDKQVCEQVRSANGARVAEGIKMLETAIGKRPEYDDAMFFMVLLLRERADMQCGDLQAWTEYHHLSDRWIDVGYHARKQKIQSIYQPSEKNNAADKSDIFEAGCLQPNPIGPAQSAQQQPQ
jgi:tetratricopeptide (TPR) repeat protein